MRVTLKQKLEMVKANVIDGKSISHAAEMYNYDIGNLKYLINLYKRHGEEVFINRGRRVYKRDTKLIAISRVLNGESIRNVALDLRLIEPTILGDWVRLYKTKGKDAIKDTYQRQSYMTKDERAKHIVDKALQEENERLRAEIEYLKKSQSLTQKLEGITNKEKSLIVKELRKSFKFEVLLEIAQLSPSTYYYNLSLKEKPDKYKEIKDEIDYLYLNVHKKRIGYQRLYNELKRLGYKIGKNKVLEIMRDKGYLRQKKRNWRRFNAYQGDLGWVKPNHMDQNFTTTKPYEKGGTDITVFPLNDEAVYLSPIIDFHTREILSYTVGKNAKMDKIKLMLKRLEDNHKDNLEGMVIQSDQGVQYQNSRYSEGIEKLGMIQSMSRKGNCLDNSPTENFFGIIKREIWNDHKDSYKNANELIKAINEYIIYYNKVRPSLRFKMSPYEYRQTLIK